MIGPTDAAIRGEDPATTTTRAPTVEYPQDTKTTITKEITAKTQGNIVTTEKIRVATDSLGQGVQENTTSHQMICSMGHATCTTHTSTEREYQGMQ
jgi:hypothetical protein